MNTNDTPFSPIEQAAIDKMANYREFGQKTTLSIEDDQGNVVKIGEVVNCNGLQKDNTTWPIG